MEKIKEWVKCCPVSSDGYGYGSGDGSGDVYGSGYGDGYGSGYGDGSGDGSGSGSGSDYGYSDGSGSGDCSGYGDGSGSGDCYGEGDGSGSGYGMNIMSDYVCKIDGVSTIIKSIKGLIAKGCILNKDFTRTDTFIVKDAESKYFAHGKTIAEAMEQLEIKIFDDIDIEEKIDIFLSKFDMSKKYEAKLFFDWHGKLTNSCLQGRESFVKNNDIKLDELMTVKDFIEITEFEFGREVIKQLKERLIENGSLSE